MLQALQANFHPYGKERPDYYRPTTLAPREGRGAAVGRSGGGRAGESRPLPEDPPGGPGGRAEGSPVGAAAVAFRERPTYFGWISCLPPAGPVGGLLGC